MKFSSLRKLKPLVKLLVFLGILAAVFITVLKLPQLHAAYVRHKVSSYVFEIRGTKTGGGGTGFQLLGPSGTPYIVTNSHICEGAQKDSKDQNHVLVKRDNHWLKRRILEIDENADLCLVEAWPSISGLTLGDEVEIGEKVSAIGHPRLGPTTKTDGEVTAFESVSLQHHIMKSGDAKLDGFLSASDEACNLPKNFVAKQMLYLYGILPLGEVPICFVKETNAIRLNVIIFPGNSGSPLVDSSGNVVGVVFATDSNTNWGFAVNLNHLVNLLKDY